MVVRSPPSAVSTYAVTSGQLGPHDASGLMVQPLVLTVCGRSNSAQILEKRYAHGPTSFQAHPTLSEISTCGGW